MVAPYEINQAISDRSIYTAICDRIIVPKQTKQAINDRSLLIILLILLIVFAYSFVGSIGDQHSMCTLITSATGADGVEVLLPRRRMPAPFVTTVQVT